MTKKAVPKSVKIACVNDETFKTLFYWSTDQVKITPECLVPLTGPFTDVNALRRHVAARVDFYDDSFVYDPRSAWKSTLLTERSPTPPITSCQRLFWLVGDDGSVVRPLADVVDFRALKQVAPHVSYMPSDVLDSGDWHVRMFPKKDGSTAVVMTPSFPTKASLVSFLETTRWAFTRDHSSFRRLSVSSWVFYVFRNDVMKHVVNVEFNKLDEERRKRKATEELKLLKARAFPNTSWEEAMTVSEPELQKVPAKESTPAPASPEQAPPASDVLRDTMGAPTSASEQDREERERASRGGGDRLQNIVDALDDAYAWTNAPWPGSKAWYEQEALEQTSRSFRNRR